MRNGKEPSRKSTLAFVLLRTFTDGCPHGFRLGFAEAKRLETWFCTSKIRADSQKADFTAFYWRLCFVWNCAVHTALPQRFLKGPDSTCRIPPNMPHFPTLVRICQLIGKAKIKVHLNVLSLQFQSTCIYFCPKLSHNTLTCSVFVSCQHQSPGTFDNKMWVWGQILLLLDVSREVFLNFSFEACSCYILRCIAS